MIPYVTEVTSVHTFFQWRRLFENSSVCPHTPLPWQSCCPGRAPCRRPRPPAAGTWGSLPGWRSRVCPRLWSQGQFYCERNVKTRINTSHSNARNVPSTRVEQVYSLWKSFGSNCCLCFTNDKENWLHIDMYQSFKLFIWKPSFIISTLENTPNTLSVMNSETRLTLL